MSATIFKGRQAVAIENDHLRVTVLREGGHIAEIFDKVAGVSPLWVPPWPSIEPSSYELSKHPEYGSDSESKLLAGIIQMPKKERLPGKNLSSEIRMPLEWAHEHHRKRLRRHLLRAAQRFYC